jgi:hypothetical protein
LALAEQLGSICVAVVQFGGASDTVFVRTTCREAEMVAEIDHPLS